MQIDMDLGEVFEYFLNLSSEAKARYGAKLSGVGLNTDPYTIPTELSLQSQTRFQLFHGVTCLFIITIA